MLCVFLPISYLSVSCVTVCVYRSLLKSSLIEVPLSHRPGYSSIATCPVSQERIIHNPPLLSHHPHFSSKHTWPSPAVNFSPRNVFPTDRDFSLSRASRCFAASLLYSFSTSAELSARADHLLRQLHLLEVCLLLSYIFSDFPCNASMSWFDDRKRADNQETLKKPWLKSHVYLRLAKAEAFFWLSDSSFWLCYMIRVQQKRSGWRYILLL